MKQNSSNFMKVIDDNIIIEIITKFKTPCYIYNASIIEEQYKKLKICMNNMVDIFYSLKSNPNISIAKLLYKNGTNIEVCSLAELFIAKSAGFMPYQIIFVGPAKSRKEILECLNSNILAIICESINELIFVDSIATEIKKIANIAIRINPDFVSQSALLKMGGKPSQFGIDQKLVKEAFEFITIAKNLNLIGVHIYNGTRILNAKTIIENSIQILTLVYSFVVEFNLTLNFIDIGGGFGINYFENEMKLNIDELAMGMQSVLSNHYKLYPNTRIFIESGRFLVAESGILVTKILDIKKSKGETFLITNGGTNCHMAAVGIGSFVKRNFPIYAIKINDKQKKCNLELNDQTDSYCKYQITGPLCTPNDVIGKDVILTQVNIGDYIVIMNSGAYGPTASPVYFLSHGYPAEVLIKNNQFYLIRNADTVEDLLSKHLIVDIK